MKKLLSIVFVLGMSVVVKGQLYDAQWALGYYQSVVDFREAGTVRIDSLPNFIYYTLTNASICDSAGNLLYYTNGISICTPSDTLLNGNNLSPCPYTDEYAEDGLNIPQAAIFIPKPGSNRYYYLFHFTNDTLSETRPGTLYYSVIDADGNGGLGSVISKNNILLQGHALREGGMTACKHANGRDYWLVVEASVVNTFYTFLVTPNGISRSFTQSIGPEFPLPYDVAYSKFSQDGSKYATGTYDSRALIMDFDRCSGEFSNPVTIFNNASGDSVPVTGCGSIEFSPNNRFIYVSANITLEQYDTWATNIQDSSEIYRADTSDFYHIDKLQLAPNGKMYACTWNGGLSALHVINYPDEKGDSADFVYGGQPTFSLNSDNLPNLINYKLGPLVGSGCDTIPTAITEDRTKSQEPRVLPNPADKYVYVEMGMQGNYEFDLINSTGQVLATKQTPQVDIFDTQQLAGGVYFIRVIDKATGAEVGAERVVVVH